MPYGLGNYRRTPIGLNTAAFADVVGILRNNSLQASQQQSAVEMALAQLPVNAAEDEWRMNLSDEIKTQMEGVENPADRLQVAIKTAGGLMNRPDVIGRIRAEAEYQNFVKQTQARTDIGQDIKDWALANNPYTYEDKLDANGRIVGGSMWKPTRTPVSTVPLNNLLEQAKKWVNADAGGGVTDIAVVDADGNTTNDITKNAWGLAYKKNGRWERLSEEKLQLAINASIESTPGAKASLQQDYDVAKWKYDKLTPEEKKNLVGSDITDDKGFLLSPQQFIAKKINPAIAAMQYNHQYSDIEIGNGITNYYNTMIKAAKAGGGLGSGSGIGGGALAPYGMTNAQSLNTPVTIDMGKVMGDNYGTLSTSISQLAQLYPNLSQQDSWKRLVANGDYNGLAQLATKNMTSKDPAVRARATRLINEIRDNGQMLNDYLDGLGKDEKDAARFYMAIQSGSELPVNNKYTTEFVNKANSLLDGADHGAFVVQDNDQLQGILNSLGCKNVNELKSKFGLDTTTYDGRTAIVFRNNSRGLAPLAEAISHNEDAFWSWNNSKLVLYNADGSERSSSKDIPVWANFIPTPLGAAGILHRATGNAGATNKFNPLAQTRDINRFWETHPAANAAETYNDIMTSKGKITNTRTLNTLGNFSMQLADLDAAYNAGALDESAYKTRYKTVKDNTDMQVLMHDYTQTEMYAIDEAGAMVSVDPVQRKEIGDRIAAIKPADLHYNAGDNDFQVGTIIDVPAKYDKNNDKVSEAIRVFVPNLLDSESDSAYKNDTSFRARRRAASAALYNGTINQANDYPITNITENGGLYNGRPISYQQVINFTDADLIIEDCKKMRDAGYLQQSTALQAAQKVVSLRGEYLPGSPGYEVAVQKIYNEIATGL